MPRLITTNHGIIADGITDQYAALQALADVVPAGTVLVLPPCQVMRLSRQVLLPAAVTVDACRSEVHVDGGGSPWGSK